MKNLTEYTTDELRKELENRGYQTANLWQIADVDQKIEEYNTDDIEFTEAQKMGILIKALHNDAAMSAIWDCIEYELSDEIFQINQ